MSPRGLLERLPVAERLQSELQHPLRLALLLGDEPHDVLGESYGYYVGVHVCGEAVFVLLLRHLAHVFILWHLYRLYVMKKSTTDVLLCVYFIRAFILSMVAATLSGVSSRVTSTTLFACR